jgi:photosystem II stability/assembly factor-like uncharacterized protein
MRIAHPLLFSTATLLAVTCQVAAQQPAWEPVAAGLIAREKPGYGGLSGVAVDRATGRVFVALSDRGVFRSSDQGRTWERHAPEVKGRTETPGCMQLDPTGKTGRLLVPMVYGGPIAVGAKDDASWRLLDPKVTHVDWCAADWTGDGMKLLLTLKHESGGLLLASRDGGASFEEVGKNFGPAWVFDANTAVVTVMKGAEHPQGSILRTTDGARTFQSVASLHPIALPRWHGNALYWLLQDGLVKSTNRGETWTRVCDLPQAQYGPVFGKRESDMFVLTRAGVVTTTDAGRTWSKTIPLPDWKGASQLTWIDYDPVNDLLYAMKMGSDLYRLSRPAIGS